MNVRWYAPPRPEQQAAYPRDKLLPSRSGGQIGPVKLIEIRAYAGRKLAPGNRLARGDPSQFERAGARVGLAPDLGGIGQAVLGDLVVRLPDGADKAFNGVHRALFAHAVNDDNGLYRRRWFGRFCHLVPAPSDARPSGNDTYHARRAMNSDRL